MEIFENNYPTKGLLVIIGPRCSGKTTICDTIHRFNPDAIIYDGDIPTLRELKWCFRNQLTVITCTNQKLMKVNLRVNVSYVIVPCGVSVRWDGLNICFPTENDKHFHAMLEIDTETSFKLFDKNGQNCEYTLKRKQLNELEHENSKKSKN